MFKSNVEPVLLGLEIKHAGNKGDGIFATKAFQKGDCIFEESPIICCQFAWNRHLGYAACDHCLRPLETASENIRRFLRKEDDFELPFESLVENLKEYQESCRICKVTYCSKSCKEIAFSQYHKILCIHPENKRKMEKYNILLEIWKNIHYPPESTTIFLVVRILAMMQQQPDPDLLKVLSSFISEVEDEKGEIEHKLVAIKFADQIDVLRDAVRAFFGTSLKEEFITQDNFLRLMALVGRNGQGIGTSAFSDYVRQVKAQLNGQELENFEDYVEKLYTELEHFVGVEFIDNEGSGLYRIQSKCNHSCTPNVEVTFPNSNFTLALKALTDISPGDELCISYIDECMQSRSRHSRQKYLRENYVFQCACVKCEDEKEDVDETSEEEMSVDEEEEDEED